MPDITKETITDGPAYLAAAWPLRRKIPAPESEIKMWNIIRNPLPPKSARAFKINTLRDQLDVADDVYVVDADLYQGLRASKKDKVRALYTTDDFVMNYNPYIRHIVRRSFLVRVTHNRHLKNHAHSFL